MAIVVIISISEAIWQLMTRCDHVLRARHPSQASLATSPTPASLPGRQLPHSARSCPIKPTTRLQGQIRGVSDRGASAAGDPARRRPGRRAAGAAR